MPEKILFVDDDTNLLEAYKRQMDMLYEVYTAFNGPSGLEVLKNEGPFPLVIADMRMPEMDGIEFLKNAARVSPNTVRIMLTGNADLQTAVDAINEGDIFRFLTKPCAPSTLEKGIEAGIRQYRLVTSEQELLSKTLVGSISLLTEILGMANPVAYRKSSRLRKLMETIVRETGLEEGWRFELAAMLSQIGWVSFPPDLVKRIASASPLTKEDEVIINKAPGVARQLLEKVPRLVLIARMVEFQNVPAANLDFDPKGGDTYAIALGGSALKACIDYDNLTSNGTSHTSAIELMSKRNGVYHLPFLEALAKMHSLEDNKFEKVRLEHLEPGMILVEGIRDYRGNVILPKDTALTHAMIMQLFSIAIKPGIILEPIPVIIPRQKS
jgi:CheY-like chemotaxis protein